MKTPRSRRFRILSYAVYPFYITALVLFGGKLYSKLQYDVPLSRPFHEDDLWRRYYPELWRSGVYDAEIPPDGEHYDVLMLGGSVLEQVSSLFEQQLRAPMGDRLRVWKVPKSAHTSRDSFLKFSKLRGKSFDLIVIYHGINDARMNCCPAPDFKDDYSHCDWYASLQRRINARALPLPAVVLDELGHKTPLGQPSEFALDFGRTIKTEQAFRKNIEEIVAAAHAARTPTVLMSFAWHIPPDYSRAKFIEGKLDYGDGHHRLPVELWGRPDAIAATIEVHNAVLRELADRYDNVIFVDQQKLLPRDGRHFSDPCHLTDAGCRVFVDNMVGALNGRIPPR